MSTLYNNTTARDHADNSFHAILALPPLLDGHPFIADQRWLDEFASNAIIPQGIEYQGGRRLGFFYQWLWQQLITHHPCYELLAEEIQLSVDKRTLGAVDFLVNNLKTGEVEHWEVAIKFYLAFEQRWPGPNARDDLDKKANKMLSHQLMLSAHPAFVEQYQAQFGQISQRRLIMQGRIFYPAFDDYIGSGIQLAAEAAQGLWCYSEQAAKLNLKPIAKPEWIAPPRYSQIAEEPALITVSNPTMAIAPDDKVWFVMPEHWPHSSMKK
ncbi:DUF1853 family protein [Photobacterium rosenbergii]|uniref:DUF1853 family protein n=1 Tax=Photobacterium rosenbergii TaxID=294936 RepID=A0ABU3ZKK6_9GAMM|nr:DUF1853 family protein [Photobacterium rosenbergii]MDV5170640.1 DUF1853 family protein [Photobacterium rosenbergii]